MTTDDKLAITLKYPIDFAGEPIATLTFRRGRLGDLKGVKMDSVPPIEQLLLIASRMCGQPVPALDLLDAEDGSAVMEHVLGFFAKCLGGGKTP